MKLEPNSLEFQKSIAQEFKAIKGRVRHLINSAHWGEDGRYKEVMLMNYLKKVLPAHVTVGTGFVRKGNEITSQIDLIIYDNTYPTFFSEGDFVIAFPESVYGIIEVKSKIHAGEECEKTISKANENGRIIARNIFNGIFSYETEFSISNSRPLANSLKVALENTDGHLNHISLSSDSFIKYWKGGNPEDPIQDRTNLVGSFSFYKIDELSFGYFISNLIESIYKQSRKVEINSDLRNFLYPIYDGKETKRLRRLEVRLQNVPIP